MSVFQKVLEIGLKTQVHLPVKLQLSDFAQKKQNTI